jgi:hypothetical protein
MEFSECGRKSKPSGLSAMPARRVDEWDLHRPHLVFAQLSIHPFFLKAQKLNLRPQLYGRAPGSSKVGIAMLSAAKHTVRSDTTSPFAFGGAPTTGTIASGPSPFFLTKTLTGGNARHARLHFLR